MRWAMLLDQFPVGPRLARRRQHGPADLHLPIGVGERAPLLRMRRGRQHDVGVPGRLGQEDILHDEMLERGKRLARVLLVGVRHRGVLALMYMALDRTGLDRVHDLDDGQPALRSSVRPTAARTARACSASSTDL